MPLWKLQTVGKEKLDFLYEESEEDGSIELRPGVAYCFRQFYSESIAAALKDQLPCDLSCTNRICILGLRADPTRG